MNLYPVKMGYFKAIRVKLEFNFIREDMKFCVSAPRLALAPRQDPPGRVEEAGEKEEGIHGFRS